MKKLNTNQSVIQRLLERYPRGGAWMRMFFMLVLIMLSSASVKADLEFGIKVAGVEVTSNMRYDLTEIPGVSGKVSFDPNTRTLTLENATIEADVDDYAIYNESCSDLNIEVIGTCRISTSEYAAIGICESTSIYGDNGSNLFLDVQTWACAIYLDKAPLDIVNCTVEAEGANWGIAGNGEDTEVLTIRNSVVKVNIKKKDDGCASIYNIGNLVLDGCSIIEPSGAAYDKTLKSVALNGEVVKDKVVIAPKNYGIKVANVEVTEANCKDLVGITGVSGKVSFDPATKTLTLDNATITISEGNDTGIANNEVDDLTIKLIGENKVTTKKTSLGLFKPTTITGNGSLYVTSENYCGIDMKDTPITIEDTRLYVKSGMYGIAGYSGVEPEVLTIRNSNVEVEGTIEGSLTYLKNLILDGCSITQPSGAAFDAAVRGVALNGEVVKDKVVIEPDANGINDITVDVTARKQGIFTVEGVKLTQQWENLPTGIYIVDGIKRVKK